MHGLTGPGRVPFRSTADLATELRPRVTRARERWMAASVSLSTAEVASSKMRMAGSRSRARAKARRWRWPPESFWPRSPTTVS